MGEAKTKSRVRAAVVDAEARCVYCASPPATLEHMPPIVMFRQKQRPHGLEFAACQDCNKGTSAADITAAFMARLSQDGETDSRLIQEAKSLRAMMSIKAPGVLDELFQPGKSANVPVMTRGGVIVPKTAIIADGPRLNAHLDVFAAKLGMALYREHVGEPLTIDGAVFSMWFSNAGLAKRTVEELLGLMPNFGTLQQGRMGVAGQFAYRFNCDEKSIIAALASFHGNLHIFTIATSEPDKYPLDGTGQTGSCIRPGGLVAHLPPLQGLIPILRPGQHVRWPKV